MVQLYEITPHKSTKFQTVRKAFLADSRRKKRKLFFQPLPEAKTVNLDLLKIAFRQTSGKLYTTETESTFDSDYFKPSIESKIVAPFELKRNNNRRGRVFSTIHDLYFKGLHVASVESCPYSNHIKGPDEIIVRMTNHTLYGDWFDILKKIATVFRLEFLSVSQMDIALDGFNFLYPIKETLKQNIHLVGNADWSPILSGGNKIKGMTIGSRKNHRYCRAYNKSKEIEQHSKKYYIRDFWQKSGIPKEHCDNVERLEVVLKSAEIRKFEKSQNWSFLKKLRNAAFLASVAEKSFSRLYEFRQKTSKNITRAKRVFSVVYNIARENIKLRVRQSAKRIRAIQTTIKQTYLLYLKTGRSDLINYVDELILNMNFEDWFSKRKTAFDYEFHLTTIHEQDYINLWDQNSKQFVSGIFNGNRKSRRKLIL